MTALHSVCFRGTAYNFDQTYHAYTQLACLMFVVFCIFGAFLQGVFGMFPPFGISIFHGIAWRMRLKRAPSGLRLLYELPLFRVSTDCLLQLASRAT
jgi:hypothetical protein